jgi:hypothetical protein
MEVGNTSLENVKNFGVLEMIGTSQNHIKEKVRGW